MVKGNKRRSGYVGACANENTSGVRRSGETPLAETLIESAEIAFAVALALSVLNLAVGLISPSWAWATRRRSVVLRSLATIVLAGVGFAGVIGYTLMLPDSPHAFDSYLKDFDKQGGIASQRQ